MVLCYIILQYIMILVTDALICKQHLIWEARFNYFTL